VRRRPSFVSKIERGEACVDLWFFADWCQTCGARAGAVLDALPAHVKCLALDSRR